MRKKESTTNLVQFPVPESAQETHTTTPLANKRANSFIRTQQRVNRLVLQVLANDNDDEALAFVALIQMIAAEKDFAARDEMSTFAMNCAYTLTLEFSKKSQSFMDRARRK
jgi:hypothetical protein